MADNEALPVIVGVGTAAATAAAYEAWRRSAEREVIEGRTVRTAKFDPRKVGVDADTFQFKSGGDAKGVTDRLKGITKWDPVAAGKVVVYERADGSRVIADGHQRHGLATRLAEQGQNVRMDGYLFREKDGWSPRDVRVYAAIKNMKESSGQSLDMAKVMRERPDLVNTASLPMSDTKIKEARALAQLSEPAFRMVASGTVKPEHAAAVGEAVKDSSRHLGMLGEMQKANVASAQHARLYVSQVMAAPSITETTGSLFGSETQTRSLLQERAAVLDKALTALKQDKRLFGLLEREAANIEAAGNRLAHETNVAKAEGAGKTAALIEKLSTTRGPLSSMLDQAAASVAKGEAPSKAARQFVRDVSGAVKSGGINALTGGAAPAVSESGPAGWSDEARAASAAVRAESTKGSDMAKKPTKASQVADLQRRIAEASEARRVAEMSDDRFYSNGRAAAADKELRGMRDDLARLTAPRQRRSNPSPAMAAQLSRATGMLVAPPASIRAGGAGKVKQFLDLWNQDRRKAAAFMDAADQAHAERAARRAAKAPPQSPRKAEKAAAPSPSPTQETTVAKKASSYEIIDKQTGKVVGKAASVTAATRSVNKRDGEYGASRYTHRKIEAPESSGLRGTQNEANLKAIVENRQANAKGADKPARNQKQAAFDPKAHQAELDRQLAGHVKEKGWYDQRDLKPREMPDRPGMAADKPAKPSKAQAAKAEAASAYEKAFGKAPPKSMTANKMRIATDAVQSLGTPKPQAKPRSISKTVKGFTGQALDQALPPHLRKQMVGASEGQKQAALAADLIRQKGQRLAIDKPGVLAQGSPRAKAIGKLNAKAGLQSQGATGIAKKVVGPLAVVGIGAAMLAATNQAKAEGRNQTVAAAKEGTKGVGTMAAWTAGMGGATMGLMKLGMRAATANPIVQGALIAGGAVHGAITAKPGERLKGAAKGAWDMSLPGMIVNTGAAVKQGVQDRRTLNDFEARNKAFKDKQAVQKASEADDAAGLKGWANPAVQKAAQQARGVENITQWAQNATPGQGKKRA